MLINIIKALYFFLPAFVANSIPVYANRFNWFPAINKPVDFGKKIAGKRILGDHKTFRGFFFGIIAAIFVGILQFLLFKNVNSIKEISLTNNYQSLLFATGIAVSQGFGALLGDSVKSFIKRQFNINPGKPWIGPDQIDYIVGGIIFSLPFVKLDSNTIILLFVFGVALHFLSNIIMKLAGIRDQWL